MEIVTHVLTSPQTLDRDRKATARQNIGATGTVTVPATPDGTIIVDGDSLTVYDHPTGTAHEAAAVTVGNDALGHVVIGSALTKGDIGLGNVNNTSDADKPISNDTQAALDAKVDKVEGKGLSANDFTDADKNKLDGISDEANKVTVPIQSDGTIEIDGDSVTVYEHPATTAHEASAVRVGNDALGHVVIGSALTKGDIGLGNVNNTSDVDKPISTATQAALDAKVDKVEGKGLSTNDFTDNDKDRLDGIATGAQVNVIERITAGGTALPISDKTVNISVMTGATAQASGAIGLVPQPLAADVEKFLRGDGTWQVASMNEASENDVDALFDPANVVNIGGRQYSTVTIGGQIWMTENLDYKFAYDGGTLPIGGTGTKLTTPHAWYYDNEETTYGIDGYRCGLLYNGYAVDYLEANKNTLLPDGWHVPTNSEWDTLAETCGGALVAGTKLKAVNGSFDGSWPANWNGDDSYGFNACPAGTYSGRYGTFSNIDYSITFWTATEYETSEFLYFYYLTQSSAQLRRQENKKMLGGYSIRLVKTIS